MKFLQKLGKALMLPVAVLPICGILMGIGYRLCPATMQGGEISGAVNLIGLFLVKAWQSSLQSALVSVCQKRMTVPAESQLWHPS